MLSSLASKNVTSVPLSFGSKKIPSLRTWGLLITAVRFLVSPQAPGPFPV